MWHLISFDVKVILLLSILRFVLFISWEYVGKIGAKNEDVQHIQERTKFLLHIKYAYEEIDDLLYGCHP